MVGSNGTALGSPMSFTIPQGVMHRLQRDCPMLGGVSNDIWGPEVERFELKCLIDPLSKVWFLFVIISSQANLLSVLSRASKL